MIYLDNNATTKVLPEVRNEMFKYLSEEYGNPSSKYYSLALSAKKALDNARTTVATIFGCSSDEVIFTSGSTESNNMIIKGLADVTEKRTIITSCVEHSSVLETTKYLEKKGFNIIYLPVDKNGRINVVDLKKSINEDTFLVSIMWVNNELGSINDIPAIADICNENNIFLHVDATQAIGKIDVNLPKGVSSASFSAHKIHGPKGVGAIILRKDQDGVPVKLTPLIHGGEQESGYRAGTQSVHNIVGLSKAVEICMRDFKKNQKKLLEDEIWVKKILQNKLGSKLKINSPENGKVPGIINFQIKGVQNTIFLKKISKEIAASSGSACSITRPSYTLKAIGLSDEEIQNSVRFSLSPYEDISELNKIL